MIKLHKLPKIVGHRKKRLGRGAGSGVGAKSTRGTTRHQKSREKINIWFEGGQNRMIKKFPLLRGKGKNKSNKSKTMLINISDLLIFKADDEIDLKTLIEKDIIPDKALLCGVKLLSKGEITVPLSIKFPTSKLAKAKIEKAGGKVI